MKLYTPAFEKALKQGVRRELRRDPKLKKEFRRTKQRRRPKWIAWLSRLFFSFILAASVAKVLTSTHHTGTALAVVVLWTLGAAAFLSPMLAPARLEGADVSALELLPVSQRTIYLFRRDKVLIGHLLLLLDLFAAMGTMAYLLTIPWLGWLALVVVAALVWMFNVALAMFVGARLPTFRTGLVGLVVMLLFGSWLMGNKFYGPQMIAALDFAAPTLNLALPTGWPLQFVHWFTGGQWWRPLVGLIPMAYIIWSYQTCERLVSARYTYQDEDAEPEPSEQIPEALVEAGAEPGRPVGVTAIAEGILSRACFELPRWDADWMQRALWRWLTPREQDLANLVFARPLEMVRPWGRILRHLFYGTVVWQLGGVLFPPYETLILLFAMMVPFGEVLAQSWPSGAAFRTIRTFGVRISLLAPYPITFREISGLLLKCAAIQLPIVAALATGFSLLYFISHGMPWLNGLLLGCRITLIIVAARLALLVFNFASMSNDTSRSGLRALVALAIFGAEICLFFALAGFALFLPFELNAWICGAVLIATQYGFLRFYGWLLNRGTIDLMSLDAR